MIFLFFFNWKRTKKINGRDKISGANFQNLNVNFIKRGSNLHKSKVLKIPEGIEIRCIPPYLPELNLIEKVFKAKNLLTKPNIKRKLI